MSGSETQPAAEQEPALRNYLLLCLTAQAVMVLVFLRYGIRAPSLLVPFVGLAGLTVRWRIAPIFTLITLGGVLYWQTRPRSSPPRFDLADWVLCGAALAYLAAHYRYLSLTTSVFSKDPRLPSGPSSPQGDERRPPGLVAPTEVGWLVLSLPIWAFLAQLCWKALPGKPGRITVTDDQWRGLLLMWILAGAVVVISTILAYVRMQQMTRREARLYLQDALWLETAREQRKLNRWLGWARLRRERRKEKA
jgi:hypothetical protein